MKDFSGIADFGGKLYKHIFFDMDNTLTPSRSPIESEMKKTLEDLEKMADVVVVSGSEERQMWKQMTDYFKGRISFLSQNGNSAYSNQEKKFLWQRTLSPAEKKEILEHIGKVEKKYADLIAKVKKEEKLVEDRGCQISFSFVGHNAPLQDKLIFDSNGAIRRQILEQIPLVSKNVGVKIGGTTCFDYNQLGKNKGYNIKEWMEHFGWKPEDCLYVGDALFSGGNDDTVFGVCDTLQVKNSKETLAAIRKMI